MMGPDARECDFAVLVTMGEYALQKNIVGYLPTIKKYRVAPSSGVPIGRELPTRGEELDGRTLSGGAAIGDLRKPTLAKKKVSELAEASIGRRYYLANASRLGRNVIAH